MSGRRCESLVLLSAESRVDWMISDVLGLENDNRNSGVLMVVAFRIYSTSSGGWSRNRRERLAVQQS